MKKGLIGLLVLALAMTFGLGAMAETTDTDGVELCYEPYEETIQMSKGISRTGTESFPEGDSFTNNVFTRYNQLQQSQNYDLAPYAGKTVKRYVYAVTNYPDGQQDWYATVLVQGGEVIGGDVSSTRQGGKMHGFAMPAGA